MFKHKQMLGQVGNEATKKINCSFFLNVGVGL
jgi:hypothetical protein